MDIIGRQLRSLLGYCFCPVAVGTILLQPSLAELAEVDDCAKIEIVLEHAVAYVKSNNIGLLPSPYDMFGMGLSPGFQAEVTRVHRLGNDGLVDVVESMLRWKFAGLRTVLDAARQPKRMTASLASKKIELENGPKFCGICREEKAVGDVVTVLKCGHWFDDCCLEAWLNIHNSCPACRVKAVDMESQRQVIPW